MRAKRFAIAIKPSAVEKHGPATGSAPVPSSTARFDDRVTDRNQIRACFDPNSNQLIYNEAVVRALANHPMKRYRPRGRVWLFVRREVRERPRAEVCKSIRDLGSAHGVRRKRSENCAPQLWEPHEPLPATWSGTSREKPSPQAVVNPSPWAAEDCCAVSPRAPSAGPAKHRCHPRRDPACPARECS